MRLFNVRTLKLDEFSEHNAPSYAILSHTHGENEVSYADITSRTMVQDSKGWQKLLGCASKARSEGFEHVWLDTVCIDKSSSAELSEAINSMFRWYQSADVCYAYLEDMAFPAPATSSGVSVTSDAACHAAFTAARWFTRGWTLQELIAPTEVVFLSREWTELGTRESLADIISHITRIDVRALRTPETWRQFSLAQRMSWASKRRTEKMEDEAYCLLGLFGVNMPIVYGEGRRAFIRLQQEILKSSEDQTILAWTGHESPTSLTGMLAHSPADFRKCSALTQSLLDEEDRPQPKSTIFDQPIVSYDLQKGFVKLDVPLLGPFHEEHDHILENILRGKVSRRDGEVDWTKVIIALLPGCSKADKYTGIPLVPDGEVGVFRRLHYPTLVSVLKAVRTTNLFSRHTIFVKASDDDAFHLSRPTRGCLIYSRMSLSSGYEPFLTLPKIDHLLDTDPLWQVEQGSEGHAIRVNHPAPIGILYKGVDAPLPYVLIIIRWSDRRTEVASQIYVGALQDLLAIFDRSEKSSRRLPLSSSKSGPVLRALDSENWVLVKIRRAPKYHTVSVFIGPRREMNE
jgi:Heterokaryon incompatibility protein (HET)